MDASLAAIVPIYNAEQYLEDCIESLVHQTIPFNEIILIDDGSTDNSLLICQEYAKQYSNIKLLSHANQGLSYTRNRGIEVCNSEYILFVDSDDMLSTQTVEIIQKYVKQKQYDMVCFDAEILDEMDNKRVVNEYDRREHIIEGEREGRTFLFEMFPKCFVNSACMAAYRKDFLSKQRIQFMVGHYYEDAPFTIEALLLADNLYYSYEKLYIRRIRANSIMTSKMNEVKAFDNFIIAGKIKDVIQKNVETEGSQSEIYFSVIMYFYCLAINRLYTYISQDGNRVNDFETSYGLNLLSMLDDYLNFQYSGGSVSNAQLALRLLKVLENMDIELSAAYRNRSQLLKEKITVLLKKHVIEKIEQIPFWNKENKIGIYGIGMATQTIMELYQKYVNPVKAQLVFCKTEVEDEEYYQGYPVYSIRNLPRNLDYILISSFQYREEMQETLEKTYKGRADILDIYCDECFPIHWESIQ